MGYFVHMNVKLLLGELLASEWDALASVIMHQHLCSPPNTSHIYFKFGQYYACDSHTPICSYCTNWPPLGVNRAKNRQTFKHGLPVNQLIYDLQIFSIA